jgi:hypothetical protein
MAKRLAFLTGFCLLLLAGLPLRAQYSTPTPTNAYGNNMIPEGTRFVIRLDKTLETKKLKPGDKFNAKLAEDLMAQDGSSIPAGKKIHMHVSNVERGMHGRLLLSFDEIETRHGWRPLAATVTGIPGEHGIKAAGNEGEIEKKGPSGRRVVEGAVIGAAVGAAAGGVTAGPHGAIIGAAAGGALGGGAGLLTDRDLKLNKGQNLEVRLDRPLQVPR